MQKEETSEIRKIAQICKIAMECIVSGHYRPLEDRNANLWYPDGESDLTLQLDIRKRGNQLAFIIDDLHVL